MKSPSFALLVLTAALAFAAPMLRAEAAPARPSAVLCPLGVNVGIPQFVDAMKSAFAFSPISKDQKDFALDAQGWPTSDAQVWLFDNRVNMPWRMTYPDAVNQDDSGDYHLSFTGQATVTPMSGITCTVSHQIYHAATNTTTAVLTLPAADNMLGIQFTGTKGGVRNVRLILPGYPADTKQVFTTPYLNAVKPFAALRFMDFLSMNNFNNPAAGGAYPAVTRWEDRRLPSDATQTDTGNRHGVAWEYAVLLANQTGKGLWINVPISATDEYVTQLAALLKKTVSPKLHIYVEYSNEVWNSGFVQNWWNGAAAKAENVAGGAPIRYAKREIEISNLFRKVYGPAAINTTIRPVLMWQEYDFNSVWSMLQWVDKTYGAPKKYLYAIGNAAYIDADDTSSVDAVLADLGRSSEASRKMTKNYVYVARLYGLQMLAYEGGVGMSDEKDLQTKLAANRDPRIIPLLKRHLIVNWYAAGGGLFMYYALAGAQSQWGTWGLIAHDISRPDTPKYRAAVAVTRTPLPPLRVGVALPTRVGQSVSIDQNDFLGSGHRPGAPDQNMWASPGTRNDYPVQALAAGTYAITVEAMQEKAGENEQILVDGRPVVTMPLPAKATITLTPGLHPLTLIAQGHTALGGGKQIVITRTK